MEELFRREKNIRVVFLIVITIYLYCAPGLATLFPKQVILIAISEVVCAFSIIVITELGETENQGKPIALDKLPKAIMFSVLSISLESNCIYIDYRGHRWVNVQYIDYFCIGMRFCITPFVTDQSYPFCDQSKIWRDSKVYLTKAAKMENSFLSS